MSELIVDEMCKDCGWKRSEKCKVISDPRYIFKSRKGKCFARVTLERSREIEAEIKASSDKWK